tara:strand:- start:1318 stop:2073 length:756 start_codon:yes stop_codon:yes gene_type:complete
MQLEKGYSLVKNSISQSSIDKFFKSFLKICKFYAPEYFKEKDYSNFECSKLNRDLIILREKNALKFSSIYEAIWSANFLSNFYTSNNLAKIAAKFLNVKPDELCLRSPGFRMDVPHDTRNIYGWHQDSAYDKLNEIPSNGALVWCPLINTNFKNGTILLKPGSQCEDNVSTMKKKGEDLVTKQIIVPNKFLKKYKTLSLSVKKNNCAVMNANVFHKSGYNSSNKVRFTFVVRFNKILTKDYLPFRKSQISL